MSTKKRKRSTTVELCIKNTKARQKEYNLRYRLKKQIASGKLSEKEITQANKKISLASSKIDKITSKLFKCGKKYAKLKVRKKQLNNLIPK